jgi:UDP-2,3-diacylglucosamine hydrolase
VSSQKYVNLSIDIDHGPLFLISDLHAGAHQPLIELQTQQNLEALASWVHHHNGQLLILGDLFDYWHESKHRTPPCLSHWTTFFKQLHTRFQASILLTGNHDHWASTALSDLGFIVVEDTITLKSNDSKWLLIHGDGLPDHNLNLHRSGFNKLFRDPTVNVWFNRLPFQLRLHLMKSFSQYRRYRLHNDNDHKFERNYLETWLKESSYKGLVYGHTHHVLYQEFNHQVLINLGTFYSEPHVLTIHQENHRLSTLNDLLKPNRLISAD